MRRTILRNLKPLQVSATPAANSTSQPQTPRPPRTSCRHLQTPRTIRPISTTTSSSTQVPAPSPPRSQTHYTLFPKTLATGPPPSGPFAINTRALRAEFLQLQALAHPDRHSGANKARAEGTSALINEAYKTLQDPLRRAQYLLGLRGIDVAEDETARVEEPELLMAVMEAREGIEGAESEEELVPMRDENETRIEASVRVLEEAFARDDLERAREEAVRLRYWVNIRESLDAWEKGKPIVLVH